MIFLQFETQAERKKCGGDLIEIQYCRLPTGTNIKEIVSVDNITFWQLSSLYISDDDAGLFLSEYKYILTDGVYGNISEGPVDFYGINYFSNEKSDIMTKRLKHLKPMEYDVLLKWLESDMNLNGFYILGI